MSTRLFAGVLAGLALLTPPAPAAAPPCAGLVARSCPLGNEREQVKKLLKEFTVLFKEGKYAEAEAVALRARELDPNCAVANAAVYMAQLSRRSYQGCRNIKKDAEERHQGRLITVTYPVADLLVTAERALKEIKPNGSSTEEQLISLITGTISPRSWGECGGRGSIDYYPLTMSLVITQTPEVQEQICDLLAALRRMQEQEVTVEMRFLSVSDECLKKLGLNGEDAGKAILDDSQVAVLLETVQADPASRITQFPKLTCFNRQKAVIELTDKQGFVTGVSVVPQGDRKVFQPRVQTVSTGLQASVLPVVAPDNHEVTLRLAVNLARRDAPRPTLPALTQPGSPAAPPVPGQPPRSSLLTLEKTLKVPDGATALISGWTVRREAHNEVAPPVVGQPPLPGQLLRTLRATRQKEHLLVMVTPRVVVRPEPERGEAFIHPTRGGAEASEEPPAPPATAEPAVARDPAVRYVNSRSFTLAYDVEDEGPSKVAGVEVWYTRDGKTWTRYPESVRPTRAIPVTVVGDGRYGFTLVARNGAGVVGAAPKPGDEPQVWVEVDTARPAAELYAPQPDAAHPGTLVLTWRADDRNLADDPVSLEWSATPEGPWTFIGEARLPNTGRYAWRVPEDLPGKVYLRLCVRDHAGNTAVAATHEAVVVDLKVPRIRGVQVKTPE